MADDEATAALAEIRDRNEDRIRFHGYTEATVRTQAAEGDVRRLLDALSAALQLHRNETRTLHGIACLPHQRARNSLVPARGCYECRQDVSAEVCPECRDGVGAPVPFTDCRVRKAILAELTGKKPGDA